MNNTLTVDAALPVLARQEIGNYLRHKLFWFGTAVVLALDVVMLFGLDNNASSTAFYMIAPAALLGVLGVAIMFGLTRRSDRAAEAAGAVAVTERTRTLALAAAVIVPLSVALVSYVAAVIGYYAHPPASDTVPADVSAAFVHAQQFGDGVMCAIGGPLLGLLMARYLPRRGVVALASVLLVLATILLQGALVGGEQPYRVFWVWTYFVTQVQGPDGVYHFATLPGNPYIWIAYLGALCALGLVLAVRHDPDSDRAGLRRTAFGLVVAAGLLGILTMTVGFTESVVNPAVCTSC